MLDWLFDTLNHRPIVIPGLFAAAWLLSRASAAVARKVLAWHDRRELSREEGEADRLVDTSSARPSSF